MKNKVSVPEFADGPGWVSFMSEPKPPWSGMAVEVVLVSPVSSKKNSRNWLPGRNTPFSGRLNGVADLALASALALNAAKPSVSVSWIVTHLVSNTTP